MLACLCCLPSAKTKAQTKNAAIIPGEVWKDTDGNPINAHGGGLLYHEGTYYWYGEYKKGETILPEWATWECYRTDVTGVSCYSSKDLLNWKFEGIVLPAVKDDKKHDLHPSKVLERPKVIYNEKTKKFVMWAHVESADYSKACAGVAVSDSPTGTFTYVGSFRPNGAMSRDQTVFVDDNGKAYQFYSSENNATLYISELTDDYLKPTGRYTRNFVKQSREAPAVFKYNGKYYMLSSGCTGWDPNVAELAVADSIMGQWTTIGNPCTGPDADKTFYAQSTYVQQVYGKGNAYIAMFDRWKKKNLEDSRYVWLPLEFGKDGTITTTLARQLGPAYPMGRTRRLLCRQRNIPIEWQAVCHQSRRAALSTYPQSLLGPTHQAMQGTGHEHHLPLCILELPRVSAGSVRLHRTE